MRTPKPRHPAPTPVVPVGNPGGQADAVRTLSGTTVAGAAAVFVAAGAALLVAVTHASGISLLDTRPRPVPAPAGIPFAYPTKAPAPAAAASWRAPAAAVLDATVAAGPLALVGTGATARAVTTAVAGTPFTRACGAAPTAAAPVLARTLPARLGRHGVTVTLWAHPAGLGGAAVRSLEQHLRSCGSVSVSLSAGVGAESFVAASANSGDGLAYAVWNSGDVVGQVTVADVSARADTTLARAVAARTDQVLREHLGGQCRSLDSYASAASRNPYTSGYTGNTSPLAVLAPPAPALPAGGSTGAASPAPRASFTLPAAAPRPELAAPYQPDGWVPGDPDVPVQDAPKGAAPVLRDPSAFVEPTPAVRAEPAEPPRPTPAPSVTTVTVPAADPGGPGCGWAFTAMTAPVADTAALAAAKEKIVTAAFTDLADQAASYQVAALAYDGAHSRWEVDHANWQVYREYEAALETARVDLARAQARYQDAVDALNPAPQPTTPVTPPAPTTPTQSPTSSPSPATPTSSPTASTPPVSPTTQPSVPSPAEPTP